MAERLVELACYGLAGHADDPRSLLDEVADAERLGLGSVFISERFNVKEAASLTGAAAAVSSEVGIATGVTNVPIGRGIGSMIDAFAMGRSTLASMEDAIGLFRRLWRGETVFGHDGPAGTYPVLRLDPAFDEDIPVLVATLGPRTMRWAGGVADGVILHTFFTDDALARCVAAIRSGADAAGRDPGRRSANPGR